MLFLDGNGLTGAIPQQLGGLADLVYLDLFGYGQWSCVVRAMMRTQQTLLATHVVQTVLQLTRHGQCCNTAPAALFEALWHAGTAGKPCGLAWCLTGIG